MNAKDVLSRISKILNFSDSTAIQAKTADGTILQSSNFDINDDVLEVGADGKTTPAADGEYTITFTTPEGKTSTQVIDIDGGKIAEISTPSEESDEESGAPEEKGEEAMDDETTMAAEFPTAPKGLEKGEAKSLPNTTDEDPRNSVGNDTDDNKDPIITLGGLHDRLAKLEEAYSALQTKMDSAAPMEGSPAVSSLMPPVPTTMSAVDEEEELPKLDGAPIDPALQAQNKQNFGKKSADYQSTVLSKMYRY
jgi:hypothetical protein